MTLNELKTEVAALGFEPNADTSPIIITAANRALSMIYTELPVVDAVRIAVEEQSPSLYAEKIEHRGGATSIPVCGKYYSFSVSGKGSYSVRSSMGETKRAFDTSLSRYEGALYGEGELVFEGEECFTVFELSVFESVPTKVSRGGAVSVDDFTDDILSLFELPRDSRGEFILGAGIGGRDILFPADFSGIATVRYYRRPTPITSESAEIDIAPSEAFLLPLLTAYFVWLDDEPERAERYLSLYRKTAARMRGLRTHADVSYGDVTRWA